MQTATIKNQDYQGPTSNYHGQALEQLQEQFKNVKGPEQLRKVMKAWGLYQVSPRQARFWEKTTEKERGIFCDIAGVSRTYATQAWGNIPEHPRARIWRAIGKAASWGEKLRGRW